MSKAPTLFEAVQLFLGPIVAEYARIIDEGDPEAECIVQVYGYKATLKLADLKRLDEAYSAAVYQREAKIDRKFKRDDLVARMKQP